MPGPGEDLEFPERRPRVQGVWSAMDLGDERAPFAAARHEPALDRSSIDLAPPLDRLDERQLVQHVCVEGRELTRSPDFVPHPQVGRRGRRGAEIDVAGRATGRDGIERGQVVPPIGQARDRAVGDRDPPQLVAAIDRGEEVDAAAVRRRDQTRGLALGDVGRDARPGHEVVRPREVASAIRVRLRPVGREQPDVVAAAAASFELRARGPRSSGRRKAMPACRTRTGGRP